MCGTVWCGFGGVSIFCVWDRLLRVWGSEFVLCVGQFGVGLGECVCAVCGTDLGVSRRVSLCCVWESLVLVWGCECVLCVGQFGVGLGE